jgi:hypothetical protein
MIAFLRTHKIKILISVILTLLGIGLLKENGSLTGLGSGLLLGAFILLVDQHLKRTHETTTK